MNLKRTDAVHKRPNAAAGQIEQLGT